MSSTKYVKRLIIDCLNQKEKSTVLQILFQIEKYDSACVVLVPMVSKVYRVIDKHHLIYSCKIILSLQSQSSHSRTIKCVQSSYHKCHSQKKCRSDSYHKCHSQTKCHSLTLTLLKITPCKLCFASIFSISSSIIKFMKVMSNYKTEPDNRRNNTLGSRVEKQQLSHTKLKYLKNTLLTFIFFHEDFFKSFYVVSLIANSIFFSSHSTHVHTTKNNFKRYLVTLNPHINNTTI